MESWTHLNFVAVDVETTGLSHETDRIVQVGAVWFADGVERDRRLWFVDPGVPISAEASRVTGITAADVAGRPRIEDVNEDILSFVASHYEGALVAYNHRFDAGFLGNELGRGRQPTGDRRRVLDQLRDQNPIMDPLVFAHERDRYVKGKRLGDVASRMGVSVSGQAHAADYDAEVAGQIAIAYANEGLLPAAFAYTVAIQKVLALVQEQRRQAYRESRGGGR